MASLTSNLTTASLSSAVVNETSGREAAQPHEENANSVNSHLAQSVVQTQDDSTKQSSFAVNEPGKSASHQDLFEKQAQNLQELSDLKGWSVNFHVDSELNQTVIKVVDADTHKVIRQIPSEEMLAISKRLQEFRDSESSGDLAGLLFNREI